MVSLKSAELLISVMTFFIAYLGAVTIAGFFRAWTARKMGDDTAQMMGLMTLNPLDHVDMIGLVFLLLFYFGWGKYIPINPFNIQDPHRRIKLIITYLSDSVAYLMCALVGIVFLIAAFGVHMLFVANTMLVCVQNMTHLYLVQACPTFSSLSITLSFIIIAFVYLNVILGVLNLILNSFSLLMYFIMERSTNYKTYNYYLIVLVPIILIVLFSEPLRILAIKLISMTGYSIAHLLHVV